MTKAAPASVRVKSETIYPDGGYVALIGVYGSEFAVHYTNGEIKLFNTASASAYDRRPRWQRDGAAKTAKAWASARIAAQPTAWHDAHRELYAEEA